MSTTDLSGKVAIVTGANTGIGRVTALELARAGAHTLLACRSRDRTEPVIANIRAETGNEAVEFLELDLASFDSIRACTARFVDRGLPLHLLINNAGVAGIRGLTNDGFELTFGVNHLGHFLLTLPLLDVLERSAPARIVNVSSRSHYDAKTIDFSVLRSPTAHLTGLHEYEVSKLANVLFTAELSRRLKGTAVTTYAVHPGTVASDIWRHIPGPLSSVFNWLVKPFMLSNEQGARTTLYCAMTAELDGVSGKYYAKSREKAPNPAALDEDLAAELWQRSAGWVGLTPTAGAGNTTGS